MAPGKLDGWAWVCVYLGMALLGLGLAVSRSNSTLGWSIASVGILFIVVGIVLIWARSRIKSPS